MAFNRKGRSLPADRLIAPLDVPGTGDSSVGGHPPLSGRASGARTTRRSLLVGLGTFLGVGALMTANLTGVAFANVGLGVADSYGVLAGAGVTNTGTTTINGDLGTCPNPTVTGAPVVTGETHQGDTQACEAKDAFTTAYNDAAGRAPDVVYAGPTELGSPTPLTAGVYKSPSSFGLTGTLTLDGQGNPDSVFIFQATNSTLITAPDSRVQLINEASACNVFWQVGSSATLDVRTDFVGTILAAAAIAAKTGTTVQGRLMAGTESVTLDTNVVTVPQCASQTATTTGGGPTSTTGAPVVTTTVVGELAPITTITSNPAATLTLVSQATPTTTVTVGSAPSITTVARAVTGTTRTTARDSRGAGATGRNPALAGTGSSIGPRTTAVGATAVLLGAILVLLAGQRFALRRVRSLDDFLRSQLGR